MQLPESLTVIWVQLWFLENLLGYHPRILNKQDNRWHLGVIGISFDPAVAAWEASTNHAIYDRLNSREGMCVCCWHSKLIGLENFKIFLIAYVCIACELGQKFEQMLSPEPRNPGRMNLMVWLGNRWTHLKDGGKRQVRIVRLHGHTHDHRAWTWHQRNDRKGSDCQ